MIAVEFEATRDDMSAFQAFVTAGIRKAVRTPSYYGTLAILMAVVGVFVSGAVDFAFHVPTVLAVLLLFAVFWAIISRMYRRAATPIAGGSLMGPRKIVIDEEGIRQIAPLYEGRTNWRAILSIHETPTHIFLMTDRLAGYIVPRHAFGSPAQCAEFIAFARAHAGMRPALS